MSESSPLPSNPQQNLSPGSMNPGEGSHDPSVAMDRMYRMTRHVYDLTRRYYLLGRDRLLDKVTTSPQTATLEVGCGTARNLIRLAHRRDAGLLYGVDASHEMLKTATLNIKRSGMGESSIMLRQGLAEQLDRRQLFGREELFDTIFFSYSLSMIPTWKASLEVAMENLRPGGTLLIVDFWDQKELSPVFAAGLKKWLALFHVHYRPELHEALVELGQSGRCNLTFESVARRYAYIATIIKK